MKGHKEDICNEEQQVTTSLQICTCQREADTCDRYILLSTCLVQNPMCSQQHGGQGSKASLSAWRHSEALMESPLESPFQVCTTQESQTSRRLLQALSENRLEKSCMVTLDILGAQRSCPFLIWPHRSLLPAGRPASLSVCSPNTPSGVKPSGRGENGEFQKFSCRVGTRD